MGFRGTIAVLRHLEWFLEKMAESRPPKIGHFRGGLLSVIFSKKHSKSLKTAFFGSEVRNREMPSVDLRHLE